MNYMTILLFIMSLLQTLVSNFNNSFSELLYEGVSKSFRTESITKSTTTTTISTR